MDTTENEGLGYNSPEFEAWFSNLSEEEQKKFFEEEEAEYWIEYEKAFPDPYN